MEIIFFVFFVCYLSLMHNEVIHRGQTVKQEFYTFCDMFEKEGRGNEQNFDWNTAGFFTMLMPQCTWHTLSTSFLCKTKCLCFQNHPVAFICQQETSYCSRKWKLAEKDIDMDQWGGGSCSAFVQNRIWNAQKN